MNHNVYFRATLVAFALLFSSSNGLFAGDSATENSALENSDTAGCVLLRNNNVLFGKAIQRGDQVIVNRTNKSLLQLSRRDVLCWAATVQDLYKYRVDHRMANTATEHVETARWCIRYELFEGALAELKAAEKLRIDQREVVRLKQQLYRAVIAKQKSRLPQSSIPAVPEIKTAAESAVVQVSHNDQSGDQSGDQHSDHQGDQKSESEELDLNTLRRFMTVQPTLVNRCGGCHNSRTDDVKWQLHVPRGGSRLSSRLTRENLIATLAHISFEAPLESELRIRSLDGHAGEKSTFGPRDVVINHSMEQWLQMAQPAGAPLSLAKHAYERASTPDAMEKRDQGVKQAIATTPVDDSSNETQTTDQPSGSKRVARLPVANPFDPEIFNRQMHKK